MMVNMLTTTSPLIGALVGSTRPGSFNQRLADLAVAASRQELVQIDGLDRLPLFGEAIEDPTPTTVTTLRRRVARVDGLLVVTPEHNSGMPAVLKNAIDWLSRPRGDAVLAGYPTVVIGASPSPGGAAGAVADAVRVLSRAGADVIGDTLTLPRAYASLEDPDLPHRLADLLEVLTAAIETRLPAQR